MGNNIINSKLLRCELNCTCIKINKKIRTGPTQFKIILAEEHIALRVVSSLTSAIITRTSFVSYPGNYEEEEYVLVSSLQFKEVFEPKLSFLVSSSFTLYKYCP